MGSQSMGGKEETLCHDHGLLRNHHFIHPGPSSVHCTAFHCISSIPAAHVYNVCSVFHCISTIPVTEVYNVRSVFHCISSTPATKVYDVLCSTVIHPTHPDNLKNSLRCISLCYSVFPCPKHSLSCTALQRMSRAPDKSEKHYFSLF